MRAHENGFPLQVYLNRSAAS